MLFLLKSGKHQGPTTYETEVVDGKEVQRTVPGRSYKPGDYIESDDDLAAMFNALGDQPAPRKFELVDPATVKRYRVAVARVNFTHPIKGLLSLKKGDEIDSEEDLVKTHGKLKNGKSPFELIE